MKVLCVVSLAWGVVAMEKRFQMIVDRHSTVVAGRSCVAEEGNLGRCMSAGLDESQSFLASREYDDDDDEYVNLDVQKVCGEVALLAQSEGPCDQVLALFLRKDAIAVNDCATEFVSAMSCFWSNLCHIDFVCEHSDGPEGFQKEILVETVDLFEEKTPKNDENDNLMPKWTAITFLGIMAIFLGFGAGTLVALIHLVGCQKTTKHSDDISEKLLQEQTKDQEKTDALNIAVPYEPPSLPLSKDATTNTDHDSS